jgi:hypothetical protein
LGAEPATNRRRQKQRGLAWPPADPGRVSLRQALAGFGYILRFSREAAAQLRAADNPTAARLAVSQDRTTSTLAVIAEHPMNVIRGSIAGLKSDLRAPFEDVIDRSFARLRNALVAMMLAPDLDALFPVMFMLAGVLVPLEEPLFRFLIGLAEGQDPIHAGNRFLATLTEVGL